VEIKQYRKIFRDIVRGYSEAYVNGIKYYVKHLTSMDQVDIDDVESFYLKKAKERGLKTQAEILPELYQDNTWSKQQENQIERLTTFLEELNLNKKQLVLKSAIDRQNKSIEETKQKIESLQKTRSEAMGANVEDYAAKRSNDHYIIKSFFNDPKLEQPVFADEDSFSELYLDEVLLFINEYNLIFRNFDELVIQTMILQDFYYIYFPFSDDTVGFFGHPVCELTYNQLKLIVYTKIFKNIFEQNPNIPPSIKKDPQALLDYGNISDEAKSKMKKQIEKGQDGSTLFGATAEDYEYAGLENPNDKVGISLQKAAQKKGGTLNMNDLMELSGHGKKK
jgi:hypothetical protein